MKLVMMQHIIEIKWSHSIQDIDYNY